MKHGCLVELDVTSGRRFSYETFILGGLFARLDNSDLLGDGLENHLLKARIDEFVRLRQFVEVDTWVSNETPVVFRGHGCLFGWRTRLDELFGSTI